MTRLGLWLEGPWPTAEGTDGSDGTPTADRVASSRRAEVVGSSLLDHLVDLVDAAERSGFDSVWVTDRDPEAGEPAPPLEAYSLLGALASRTQRARLGAIPVGVDRRTPSVVAKTVTGIDVISHGRGILTYGLGSDDPAGSRVIEALRVGRALLEDENPTFSGTFYSVVDARNKPAPVQVGGVPVVISVNGPADLATVAVTALIGLADAVIVGGDADGLRRIVDEVASALRSPDHGEQRDLRPLQVVGVASVPNPGAAHWSSPQSGVGPEVSKIVSSVRDLIEAGVDGCLVPMGLGTGPEVLTALGRKLGDLTGHGGAVGPNAGAR